MQEKESIAFGQILELLIKNEEGLANRQNFQGYLCNPDKFNPSDSTQPQLKTFILFEEYKGSFTDPTPKYLYMAIRAESETAVAKYFGGEYRESPDGVNFEPSIFLPKKLFKHSPPDNLVSQDMLEFSKDELCVYIDPDDEGRFVRIQELSEVTVS